jgi:hypothetical protein
MGILESLDQLIAGIAPTLQQMGDALAINVNMPDQYGGTMPLSAAALEGFIRPWANNLGQILGALASFLNAL